jgi:hypothetical protein
MQGMVGGKHRASIGEKRTLQLKFIEGMQSNILLIIKKAIPVTDRGGL